MIIKPLSLDDNLLRSYKVARVFRENTDNISGINFSPNGNFLVSCGLDHKIDLYNCHKGTHVYFTFSNKYGVDNICYTPDEDKVIHSSTMNNDAIRYLCFSTNSYIRYFTGLFTYILKNIVDYFKSSNIKDTIKYMKCPIFKKQIMFS